MAVKDRTKAILQSNQPVPTLHRFKRQRIGESSMSHRRSLEDIEEIREASYFNLIKMHLLTHFWQHVKRFGNIPMFSTDFSELAHKGHIKESYKSSNKVDTALQILDISTRRQAFELGLLNLQRLQLKHPNRAVNNLKRVAEELGVDLGDFGCSVLRFGRGEQGSGSFRGTLQSILEYPTENFAFLHVPVPEFQEADRYELHNLRCNGKNRFRKRVPRNDWVWIHAGEEHEWGALRGRLPARRQVIFKIPDMATERTHRLCMIEVLEVVNGGHPDSSHGLVEITERNGGTKRAFDEYARVVAETRSFPVCLTQAFFPDWFVTDGPDVRELARPFITNTVLMLPTFNHLLQAIRRRTPAHRVEEGGWVPRQILVSTSPSIEWNTVTEGTRSRPDLPDIINIKDDEDVRVWILAACNQNVLRLFVVFHQLDHLGKQSPAPDYRAYLAPEI
ncbi:hypothetical protein Q9L58_010148 [Maublancomyces gigas]|uniref:Uncharacterized protein n=1 Tax=Discina gigas TaxID=1032678 RepID=A0ABR3G4Y8_9PEZI